MILPYRPVELFRRTVTGALRFQPGSLDFILGNEVALFCLTHAKGFSDNNRQSNYQALC